MAVLCVLYWYGGRFILADLWLSFVYYTGMGDVSYENSYGKVLFKSGFQILSSMDPLCANESTQWLAQRMPPWEISEEQFKVKKGFFIFFIFF